MYYIYNLIAFNCPEMPGIVFVLWFCNNSFLEMSLKIHLYSDPLSVKKIKINFIICPD